METVKNENFLIKVVAGLITLVQILGFTILDDLKQSNKQQAKKLEELIVIQVETKVLLQTYEKRIEKVEGGK